ncbi:MAG TPA: GNAT family N-acetyltransferase [Vicinamibacterales bacterium]|nr:GNAT family N-acetyltransferase [Vicinamibacterales bacterium]
MSRRARITLRPADATDARRLHALITAALAEGHLLPRTLPEIALHASRFVVAVRSRKIVGCAELAPLSPQVAEVRSLVVDPSARHHGVGGMLVDELRARARRDGFDRLCAFTHAPGYFMPMGFSIVPHLWLTEKVYADCVKCPQFRTCGQYAMVLPLESLHDAEARDHMLVARHA